MKKIIEVFKKEELTEYVCLLFVIGLFLAVIITELWVNINPLAESGIIIGGVVVWSILAYKALKHDWALADRKKDEREVAHDAAVGYLGYRVIISLLGFYWFVFDMTNLWLFGIIFVTLLTRLVYRYILESDVDNE